MQLIDLHKSFTIPDSSDAIPLVRMRGAMSEMTNVTILGLVTMDHLIQKSVAYLETPQVKAWLLDERLVVGISLAYFALVHVVNPAPKAAPRKLGTVTLSLVFLHSKFLL